MSYSCKILLDSISETGKRLTTFEITFPRIVLAELNTHRMFSRNSASSRAIPFEKMLNKVLTDPYIPEQFPINKRGMQPSEYVSKASDPRLYKHLKEYWLTGRDSAVDSARLLINGIESYFHIENHHLDEKGNAKEIHKQLVNRLLEPFQYHTVICTATEFDNFFKLRCDENAQYEIRRIADLMYEAYHAFDNEKWESVVSHSKPGDLTVNGITDEGWQAVKPQKLKVGEWHCPLVYEEDNLPISEWLSIYNPQANSEEVWNKAFDSVRKKISVARCARVSYLTHDGKRDIEKDLELFERLRTSGHYSPFEHIATPSFDKQRWNQFQFLKANQEEFEQVKPINLRNGNFIGWRQMRQDLPNENCTNFRKES